jgi:predicted dehydrogenase
MDRGRSNNSPPRSRPIGVGVIGTGWGANHARVVQELSPQFRLAAICSRRRERLEPLQQELALPRSALELRWERLVERPDVDLVVITTPDDLHHPITLAAVGQRKHVFCDKPLAMNAGQAAEMLASTETAGVAHFTGFTWRFAPPCATLRQLVASGRLGAVHHIDAHFRIGPPLPEKDWQFSPAHRSGGVFSNLAVHLIDLVRFLTGQVADHPALPLGNLQGQDRSDPLEGWKVWAAGDASPQASAAAGTAGALGTYPMYQSGWIHLEFPTVNGQFRARLQASQQFALRASDPVRVEVHGSLASAVGYANPLKPHRQRVDLLPQISADREPVAPLLYLGGPPAPPTAQLPSGGLLRPTLRHLYEDHIGPRLAGNPPNAVTPTFWDGYIVQRLLDAALESASQGEWIEP